MSAENLGQPLTGTYAVDGSQARVFERGATIKGPLGDLVVVFKLPRIGVPHIAAGTAERATALAPGAFTFRTKAHNLATIGALIDKAFSERVALLPTGEQPQTPIPMAFGKPAVLDGDGPEKLYGLPATAVEIVPDQPSVEAEGVFRRRPRLPVAGRLPGCDAARGVAAVRGAAP